MSSALPSGKVPPSVERAARGQLAVGVEHQRATGDGERRVGDRRRGVGVAGDGGAGHVPLVVGRLVDREHDGVGLARAVVDHARQAQWHRPADGALGGQVARHRDGPGALGRRRRARVHADVLERAGRDGAGLVGLPALDAQAALGHQEAVGVERERAGAREHVAPRAAGDEEAVAGQRQVGREVGVLQRALAPDLVHGRDGDAVADVGDAGGVGAVEPAAGADALGERVLEQHARALEAGRVDAGDVVTDHVEPELVGAQAGDAGTEGANHSRGGSEGGRVGRSAVAVASRSAGAVGPAGWRRAPRGSRRCRSA